MSDQTTKLWMRNRSDELAVENGCWFDVERGAWTVWWIERYCRLYEGEWAGERMLIRSGCPEVDAIGQEEPLDWDGGGRERSLSRAGIYADWIEAGNSGDWQYECFMRLFGWARNSNRWGRVIRRFNAGSIWIPKKQKKSPSLASIGTYLVCGDGEQGAKCFGGAKDGNQASIAMAHAIAMIEQSPELSSECKINRNEKSIEHVPTRSKYKPLSSANSRTKNSKEGINGHILIDETHVVDRDFIAIISRAGISRAEPLHLDFSTAGSNPDGYGKERQDYARRVMSGVEPNDQLFVAIYEAPQDLSDAELDADPIKYGKMANPAWGHTAHEEEFLADYRQSKQSLSLLADFKMYRLNIWQSSSSPWIKLDQWDACEDELSDWSNADAIGGGVDLGSRDDLAAYAFCARFQIGEEEDRPIYRYEIDVRAYISEDTARDIKKQPFGEWVYRDIIRKRKYATLDLRDDLIAECRELYVSGVAYDPYNAQALSEELTKEGITAYRMAQNHSMFNEPIEDFTQCIADGRMRHNGDPLLRWCANHAVVNKNRQMQKMFDKRSSSEKIDPLVASVMAFRACSLAPARPRGSLFIN